MNQLPDLEIDNLKLKNEKLQLEIDELKNKKQSNKLTSSPSNVVSICIAFIGIAITVAQFFLAKNDEVRKEKQFLQDSLLKASEIESKNLDKERLVVNFVLDKGEKFRSTQASMKNSEMEYFLSLLRLYSSDQRQYDKFLDIFSKYVSTPQRRDSILQTRLFDNQFVALHYKSTSDFDTILSIKNALEANKFRVQGEPQKVIQQVFGKDGIDIRYFHPEDIEAAEAVRTILGQYPALKGKIPTMINNTGKYTGKPGTQGLIEVWIGAITPANN